MPKRARTGIKGWRRRKRRRKRGAFRRRRRKRRMRLPLGGFPTKKLVRIRYSCQVALDPNTATIPYTVLSANGVWDPEVDALTAGHQPRGFDQWMMLYDHYTVIGSKIKAYPFFDFGSGAGTPNFGIVLSDTKSFPFNTFTDLAESRLAGGGCKASWRNLGTKTYTKGFSTRKFFGVKNYVNKELYRGSATTNPEEGAYYQLWCCTPDRRNVDPVSFQVTIDYLVMFTEPKYLAKSD